MGRIDSRVLFLTTSPRTPAKMIPEIALLHEHFAGMPWNKTTQEAFMEVLKEENFFNGSGENDPSFSARDRINRAPQTLGFVMLKPHIQLTPAGVALTTAHRTEEVFLRQLLKFQIPSPYHRPSERAATFCVKPYLEIFRLLRHFGTLSFDEVKIFALQLTDYRQYEAMVRKIEKFRKDKAQNKGSYRRFEQRCFDRELRTIYAQTLAAGHTATRESSNTSETKFLLTKGRNMRDYADACCRYLRATGMVNISYAGRTLSIIAEKQDEVDFFLQRVDRRPCFVDDYQSYIDYLGDVNFPILLTDNRERLLEKFRSAFPSRTVDESVSTAALKILYEELVERRKQDVIDRQVQDIRDCKLYEDIRDKYQHITDNNLYDAPLMLEWNTWRAMTMIDGGEIKANLRFDDFGQPMSTAQGNMADIVCDYGEFGVSVEVTTASGQRQYEMEGEPVARHLGNLKQQTGKPFYCLFIAPSINDACVAHFFMLHKTNVAYYGGKSVIIPLPLTVFEKMVDDAHKANYIPQPQHVRRLFEYSMSVATICENEKEWYGRVVAKAINWLE